MAHTRAPLPDRENRKRGRAQAGFPAYNESDDDTQKKGKQDRGRGGKGRKKTEDTSTDLKRCPICERAIHKPKDCWYSPGVKKAPKRWTPHTETKAKADENLKKPEVKKLLEAQSD